jgi:hypothetical protein
MSLRGSPRIRNVFPVGYRQDCRSDYEQNALDDDTEDAKWFGPVTDVVAVVGQSGSAREQVTEHGARRDSE